MTQKKQDDNRKAHSRGVRCSCISCSFTVPIKNSTPARFECVLDRLVAFVSPFLSVRRTTKSLNQPLAPFFRCFSAFLLPSVALLLRCVRLIRPEVQSAAITRYGPVAVSCTGSRRDFSTHCCCSAKQMASIAGTATGQLPCCLFRASETAPVAAFRTDVCCCELLLFRAKKERQKRFEVPFCFWNGLHLKRCLRFAWSLCVLTLRGCVVRVICWQPARQAHNSAENKTQRTRAVRAVSCLHPLAFVCVCAFVCVDRRFRTAGAAAHNLGGAVRSDQPRDSVRADCTCFLSVLVVCLRLSPSSPVLGGLCVWMLRCARCRSRSRQAGCLESTSPTRFGQSRSGCSCVGGSTTSAGCEMP